MKSDLPKVLFPVCGSPMVALVARALTRAGVERPIIVIGHGGEKVIEALGSDFRYAWQREQKGSGHAVQMALDELGDFEGSVIVACGDTPLLNSEVIDELIKCHQAESAVCTVASMTVADPTGYGRMVTMAGKLVRIVEDRDASPDERTIREVNSGLYCIDAGALRKHLPNLQSNNSQGEYYFTDIVSLIYDAGGSTQCCNFNDSLAFAGVNNRWQLAEVGAELRRRTLMSHALNGVTIVDPTTTYVGTDVEIGTDVTIEPNTTIHSGSRIGEGSVVGPNSVIAKSIIGKGCSILMSHLNGATLGDNVRVGPFANLRPGTNLADGVKIGNFVEIKNAKLGPKTSASHLTYIGDATVGSGVNIGAGTITCNYDGYAKHHTTIGNGVFVGSNSTLIAPVTLGEDSFVAAGSVIGQNVPDGALGVGRSRQENKLEWAIKWRQLRSSKPE